MQDLVVVQKLVDGRLKTTRSVLITDSVRRVAGKELDTIRSIQDSLELLEKRDIEPETQKVLRENLRATAADARTELAEKMREAKIEALEAKADEAAEALEAAKAELEDARPKVVSQDEDEDDAPEDDDEGNDEDPDGV